MLKKFSLTFGAGLLVGLFRTFVLQQIWNWFVTTAFNVPTISFWLMYGVNLVISVFTERDEWTQEQRFKALSVVADNCVPDDKREATQEQLNDLQDGMWGNIGLNIFGKLLGYSLTLALGWAVHIFLQ